MSGDNWNDLPWLVTVTSPNATVTYGPAKMAEAVAARDTLRSECPGWTVEAWAAKAPNLSVIHPLDRMPS